MLLICIIDPNSESSSSASDTTANSLTDSSRWSSLSSIASYTTAGSTSSIEKMDKSNVVELLRDLLIKDANVDIQELPVAASGQHKSKNFKAGVEEVDLGVGIHKEVEGEYLKVLSKLPDVTKDDFIEISKWWGRIDMTNEFYDGLASICDYQGFDLDKMATKLVTKHKAYINDPDTPNVELIVPSYTFGTKTTLGNDIYILTYIACNRGTKIDSIIKRSTSALKSYLSALVAKYGISRGNRPGNSDITLARITAISTPLVFHFAHRGSSKTPVDLDELWENDVPRCMKHNFVAPVWHSSFPREYVYYTQYKLSSIIKKGTAEKKSVSDIM